LALLYLLGGAVGGVLLGVVLSFASRRGGPALAGVAFTLPLYFGAAHLVSEGDLTAPWYGFVAFMSLVTGGTLGHFVIGPEYEKLVKTMTREDQRRPPPQ